MPMPMTCPYCEYMLPCSFLCSEFTMEGADGGNIIYKYGYRTLHVHILGEVGPVVSKPSLLICTAVRTRH